MWKKASLLGVTLFMALALVAACAPAAAPTPTPTKAPPPPKPTATRAAKPSAPPAAKPSGAPVKIGFVTPLSGPLSSFGLLQRIAVRLAETDINNTGGINGHPLKLLIEDSPFNPKEAVIVVRKLAEKDKVFAIIGPYSSAEFEVAAPLANELKVVVASPSSMKVGVAPKNRPWSFQMNLRDDLAQPPAIEAYKKAHPNVKKVVLTGDTKEAVTEYMVKDLFPKLLKKAGLEVIGTVAFERGTTDFGPVVTKIKSLKPDGVVLAALMPDGINFAKEYQRQGMKAPVLTSAHVTGGPFVEIAGKAVEGWIMPGLFNWEDPDPKVQSFVKRFYAQANADPAVKPKPHHVVTEGSYYDTVMIIAQIMRKAGITPDTPLQEARTKIREGLQNLKGYKGISGTWTILPTGEADRTPLPPIMAKNGKWVIIK
jgi:branched-chain amino acid transport system substrate-binding protein